MYKLQFCTFIFNKSNNLSRVCDFKKVLQCIDSEISLTALHWDECSLSGDQVFRTPVFVQVMSRDRFLLILRFLHVNDNDQIRPLPQIRPLADTVHSKYSYSYSSVGRQRPRQRPPAEDSTLSGFAEGQLCVSLQSGAWSVHRWKSGSVQRALSIQATHTNARDSAWNWVVHQWRNYVGFYGLSSQNSHRIIEPLSGPWTQTIPWQLLYFPGTGTVPVGSRNETSWYRKINTSKFSSRADYNGDMDSGGATRGSEGDLPPLFENMGLVIRPNLHRNSEGGVGWGGIVNFHALWQSVAHRPTLNFW